jgi:tetratricopeptide (TPR) repeat protein
MSQLLKEAEYVHYKMVPLVDGRDDVMNYVSKSAAKVLVLALLKNNVNSAVKLYESYDELKNPTQVNFLKGLLAEQLICLLSSKKHHQLILRIYNDIKSFEPKSIFVASLARVASKVITAFAAAGEFEQAKEVYYSVVEMDIHQEFNSSLGQAGASLMKIYQTADWGSLEEAEKLYESICSLEGKPVVKSRLKAAKHLAQIFAQKGCADKADDLRRATGRFTHVEGQAKKARKKAN